MKIYRNATCTSNENCNQVPDSTSHFLQCVGLPSTDKGRDHMQRLKGMLEATMDVYTFMRSSMKGVPILSLQGKLALSPKADPLQNEALVQMWLEAKMKPLLKSVTKHFLSCLSTMNFSCCTYQTVVREISHHFSEMDPVRQKWIYTFFMYPFLSGDRVAGCVSRGESSEDWLTKNFGAFRAMARMKDFSALNMVFSGLEVLHLLTPAQKAELLLRPEVASIDNGTLSLVFHSLLTGGSQPPTTLPPTSPGSSHNWMTTGYPPSYSPNLTYIPPPPQNSLQEVAKGFSMVFRPVGSFVHNFVAFTHGRNLSELRSTTLTQFLLNWTLSEVADLYRPHNASVAPEAPKFDVTNVEDWYEQVVMPLLRRFLPNDAALMHQNLTLAFHQVYYLDHGKDTNETSETVDVCSISLDKKPCGLTDAVENAAKVLHCAARTNLTMSEATIMRLITELTGRLNLLIQELSRANFSELASDFQQIFGEAESPSMTQEHLNDPNFIKLWFQIKLMPLLPAVPTGLLSCLSTKNFSCPVYQTIVAALSKHMSFMEADSMHSHNIYQHFIYSFLLHHNTSDAKCMSNHSAEWMEKNVGFFSRFAPITDFYRLYPNFSGLEVLHLLTPKQTAELLVLPLPTPPEKDVVVNRVFDFLLASPKDRKFKEVLHYLVPLAKEVNPPCAVYKHTFERLYGAIKSLPPDLEPVAWAGIDDLITIAPDECVPNNVTCQVTQYNDTNVCRGRNSSDYYIHMNTSVEVSCNLTLETYACAQLENFTANQLASLLRCNLPGKSDSKVLWKILLTKLSSVLDPALDILANMSMVGPSATEILDVIGEMRVFMLTDEQLMNSSVIRKWFSSRLRRFLPSASGRFLHCLSSRNLSCHSYQQIVQIFIHHFDNMTLTQQHVVFNDFVLRFLSGSGQGCVSNNSAEWLMKNLGPFSRMLSLRELLDLNPHFKPLEVLQLLTPKQTAELLVLLHPTLPDKDTLINMIFDHFNQSSDKKKFTDFLSDLVMVLQKANISCSSYKTLFKRLDMAMAGVYYDAASSIIYTKMVLSKHLPPGCNIYSGKCTVTMTNETDICAGVNSTKLQHRLDSAQIDGHHCYHSVEEFACASLSALKAEDLAATLACNRSYNSTSSRPVWKLFLSKASHVLDEALDLLANKTLDPRSPAVTAILDSIREIRLDAFSPASFNNPAVIQLWFSRLRPFLPAVSHDFLSCLITKDLNCSTYQHIVQILSHLQPHMTHPTQMSVYTHFIKVYLTMNTTGQGCVSNNSAEWLMKNLGRFSGMLSLRELLDLNPHFKPLEVLQLLTPKQTAELLVLLHPTLPDKDALINMIFDHFNQSSDKKKFTDFLSDLVMVLQKANLSCSSYKTLFKRLDMAMAGVYYDAASSIIYTKMVLSKHLPLGCNIYSGKCTVTMTNETDICAGVNSTKLQHRLDNAQIDGHHCYHSVEEFACASLSALKAEDLAATLACNRSYNSTSSRPVWKLFLSKASHVLDEALDLLANKLEVLQLLTPKQTAELLVLIHPTLPDKDALINMIFDHFNQSPDKKKFTDFLSDLVMVLQKLSALKAEDLAATLACNRSYNSTSSRPVWKLFLSKASHVLDEALDLLANKTLDPRSPAVTAILDSIREIRLDAFGPASFNNPAFIQLWFNHRLRPFLPVVSPDFLSCLTTKGLNCSTYQHIVQILSHLQPHMTLHMQMSVYTHFIKVYLTMKNATDPGCSLHTNNSGEWLQKNLGGFSALVSFYDLRMLYSNFSAMEALPYLTVRQIADVSATPGQLTSPKHVTMVMNHVPNQHLAAFFDDFSPAIMGQENKFPPLVRSAFLQVVFDRANLSDHSVDDSDVSLWLRTRLRPLLVNLSPLHVAPFFAILAGRNCSIGQQGVQDLNSTIFSLSEVTQNEIHNHIIQSLRGPVPLRCYGDNYNHSFYGFLESSFLDFQFPNLTTFLSLMPHNKMHQLVNSMPPSHLGDFLRRPDVVNNDAELCVLYNNYMQIPVFLETESLPAKVRRSTLPCVWPRALSSSERSEVNAWFDQRLQNYLVFLTKSLISPDSTYNASCLAFQKLVSVLGEHNYTAADFMRQDVFSTIRTYLTSATVPRCYNASDPELNSTAWFAEYIGPFMPFLILEDLQAFGSAEVLKVFTVNPLNIALLNHSALPLNLTNYYTELVYQQDSNFNPLLLPLLCRCVAPGLAFSQLDANESMIVLHNLTTLCTDLDPQISAALAANFGDQIDATTITSLGNESTGLSTGQIKSIKPQDLLAALGTLSSVTGWNGGQAKAIILSLISSGMMQISSASSLFQLGSLVVGIPTSTFSNVNGSQLLTASKNPSFLQHLMSAPQIIQQTFVTQIISVNSNSETIIKNIPDDLATEIPRVLLLGFSNDTTVITTLNKKKWKKQQAELFFDVVAVESATTTLGSANNLSSSVLQGFTCTGVRTIKKVQIKKLIKACRRKGKKKVKLVETQLTCMYNYIRIESDATSFDLYPPDMLLYYDYSLVPQASCKSYFEQIGDADFSIFSSTLNYKLTNLFANARSCLGITNTSLTEDNISVLGNMCCILGGFYIENSDPSILETLKTCPDLTNTQVAAVEARLQSGKTQYGAPSTWNLQTLKDLDMLPLYLTSSFYDNFDKKTKREFLKYFLKVLRGNGVGKKKKRSLKKEIRKSIRKRSTRSIENECTVGKITQVIISDEVFPFDYDDINQFNCCLSATIVKNNLASITDKVDQEEYLTIVLSKLREAYGANSTIPESQVQLLGPASRVATTDDINSWTITQIDTLSALMDSSNGQWDPSLAKAIVTKYLSQEGNKLGSAELNAIGGTNLCSLDVDVLRSISQQSLKDAEALTLSNCTTEKHKALFTIARQAFGTDTRATTISTKSYQLTSSYLPGATLDYVRSLSASDVNMDMATFTSLDENVVLDLTVNEVKNLLGTNLPDLKSYEEQTLVQKWIRSQYQSELNTLGIGLQGGRADPATTTTAPTVATVAPVTTSLTTAGSGTGTTATTGNGSRIRADPGFSVLVLLSLLIASLHFLV
ncbi:Mesothelin Pre-pro-megakaryocyte-potentiating factor [Larimichthys crocea]|uniref:Mesothelin Pre-pro-megakaryocyte-potentiating factor n=1 Tax=Larimichthys crocea TaxID=215358 RepID=A0A6G0JA47_LARCR|nr:Mesothelin Pre-pro-megakaryocyte-potentiating factor [Larimichthys crocea]